MPNTPIPTTPRPSTMLDYLHMRVVQPVQLALFPDLPTQLLFAFAEDVVSVQSAPTVKGNEVWQGKMVE
jgi:hypothetical protein